MFITIRNRKGFACQELPVAIALLLMAIVIVLPVMQGIKQGVRSGFSIQALIGTAMIQFGIGLFTGLCIVAIMFALFWIIAGILIAGDYVTGRLRKK